MGVRKSEYTGRSETESVMKDTSQIAGKLFVIAGPSGVGKGTLVAHLLARIPNVQKSVSVTTRVKRASEHEGIDYFFKSREQFEIMKKAQAFMEWAEFAGNCYGTPRAWVEQMLASGCDIILEIDVQGAKQVRKSHKEAILIFVSPPSFAALEERLRGRATETEAKLTFRLNKAKEELEEKAIFHYEVINDNLEDAVNKLADIVYSERVRVQCGGT